MMASKPLILAFDTSGPHCAAALVRGAQPLATAAEPMSRGQAERLMPLLSELLSAQGVAWADLDALAVGVGPGNFTGIRIAVSAARGLALALRIPAYGIDGFAARQAVLDPNALVTVPGPRDQLYVSDDGEMRLLPTCEAEALCAGRPIAPQPAPGALVRGIAKAALDLWPAPAPPPSPLYIRPADAAPARDAPPVMLD